MERAGHPILLDALPRLRGRLAAVAGSPLRLEIRTDPAPEGRPIDLSALASDGAFSGNDGVPAVYSDRSLGCSVAVSAVDPSAGPLAGKIVAVTGAASGIGREIARVFTAAGADVAALDVAVEGLDRLSAEIGCMAIPCDVTSVASVRAAFEKIVLSRGGLDVLVSNAGSATQGPIADVPVEELQKSFDLNFFGHQRVSQQAVRIFRAQGRGGLILFNISNQSVNPGRDFGPYGIPKAAVLALMRQYALDHGGEGIRTSGVNAGRIRTGLLNDETIGQRAAARGMTPKDYMSGNLLGVEVTARDVADAFLHLAMMEKVNAAVVTVDGGAMATAMR